MPSASRTTTPVSIDMDIIEGRYAEVGDHTVSFETFKQDLDAAPYFRGLPGDACTCQHVGYVTAGQITFRWPDREETYVEGDAYAIDIRGHQLRVDQPMESGGTDTAPAPTELFAASLAACVAFYAGRYLHRHRLPRDLGAGRPDDGRVARRRPARRPARGRPAAARGGGGRRGAPGPVGRCVSNRLSTSFGC